MGFQRTSLFLVYLLTHNWLIFLMFCLTSPPGLLSIIFLARLEPLIQIFGNVWGENLQCFKINAYLASDSLKNLKY